MHKTVGRQLQQEILTGSKERMSKPPVPTRDAATIVLLRDTPTGLQAYLLRRVPSMPFAPGMHVFPRWTGGSG